MFSFAFHETKIVEKETWETIYVEKVFSAFFFALSLPILIIKL